MWPEKQSPAPHKKLGVGKHTCNPSTVEQTQISQPTVNLDSVEIPSQIIRCRTKRRTPSINFCIHMVRTHT